MTNAETQVVTDLPKKPFLAPKARKIVNYTFAGVVAVLLVNEGAKRLRKSNDPTSDEA